MSKRISPLLPALIALAAVALLVACGSDNGGGGSCDSSGKQYSAAPPVTIDASKTYTATIKTEKGDIVVELDPSVTVTTNNFVFLAREGFYNCLTFHRVEPGFVIQGGDPLGDGTGDPGYSIPGEFEGSSFDRGVIGMARSNDPDSAGSQFYIMIGDTGHSLDGSYAAFGHVTQGQDVAESIAIGDEIEEIKIEES